MELQIYDKKGIVKMTVSPDNSSVWNHEVGVENVITVNFTTWEFLKMEVGWYILVDGQNFKIKNEYRPKHIHNSKHTYNLKFYGREHDTEDILFCRLNQGEDDFESVFSYDGTPLDMLQKVVDNMNRNSDGIIWKIGECITDNRKTINFNGLYCWDALGEIARTFGTEWWMDGEYVNLSKCIRGESVSLGYGEGLKSGLTQNENTNAVKWFTRLIPVGSTKNIDKNKYGYANLQLPGREKYIDINTQYGLKEYREEASFSEIYPHRVGTISSVRSEERNDEETGNYTVYYVKDSSLPFNPDNYMIGGEVIHITFNTGALAGKEFEVNWNNETSEFEIINQYPDENTQLPGNYLIPAIGDAYVLSNISMPDEYTKAAEKEYKEAVDAYLAEYSKDVSIYSGNTDYIHIRKNNVPLLLGQRVQLISEQYFENGVRDSRITRVSRKINNLEEASIDCSDAIASSWKSSVDSSLNQLQFSVAQEMAKTIIDILKVGDSGYPSDYNVLSSLRSLNTFLRKDKDDRTPHNISVGGLMVDKDVDISGKVNAGDKVTARKGVQIGESFAPGILTGIGGFIDKEGNAELERMTIRRELRVPTIVFNQVEVLVGDKWRSPGAGVIERVEPDYNSDGTLSNTGTCWLKLEEGQIGAIFNNAICMGIFHDLGNKANNATADEEIYSDSDDSGKRTLVARTFAGFTTCYFTITEVSDYTDEEGIVWHNKQFRYQIRPVSGKWKGQAHPYEQMNFTCYGIFSSNEDLLKKYGTSVYETRTYTRMLFRQNTWEINAANIAMQYGNMDNMSFHGQDMTGYSMFINNIYMTGVIREVRPDGTPIMVVNDRGEYQSGTTYEYYDRVSYQGSLWLCVSETGTNTTPSNSDTSWLLQVEAGVGIKSEGQWQTANTPYKANTIVTFADSVWISNKETSEAPFPIYTDNQGNRLTFNDGGYILVSPLIQSADWDLLLSAPDLTKGEDGKSIEVRYSADKTNWHSTFQEGDIYMQQRIGSDGVWSNAMRIVGETGADGTDGVYSEFQFAKNTSTTTAPTTGWQDGPPSIGNGEYLWMRQRVVNPNTETTSSWQTARIKGDTGEAGEGFTNMGQWKTGMTVPKMGVVMMGGNVYVAKVATTNPPLWCYTENTGNRLLFNNGGYILTGEVNTTEYELWLEKPKDGKDGKDGEGKQGIQGCIVRDSEWVVGVNYRNDEALTSGTRWLDVALIRDDSATTGWRAYKCKVTHTSTTGNAPGNTTYWEEFSANFTAIFTSLIIAKNAKIQFLQGNQLLLQKSDGTVTAGLSGSDEGDKTRIWAGSNIPDNAPFAVTEDGVTTSSKFRTARSGLRMEVDNGLIKVFGNIAKNIEFGVDNEGLAIMRYYDNDGTLLYDLGPNGISSIKRSADAWETELLTYVGATTQQIFGEYWTVAKSPTKDTGEYRYKFLSGYIGNVLSDPDNNRRYFKTKSKTDVSGNNNYIPDGWYVRSLTVEPNNTNIEAMWYPRDETMLPPDIQPGNPSVLFTEPVYMRQVMHIVSGRLTESINIYFNKV